MRMSRLGGVAVAACLGVGMLFLLSSLARAETPSVGEVSYIQGDAERQPAASSSWAALKQGTKLAQGDRLKTKGGARLEAKLLDGSLLRLGERSELKLETASVSKKDTGNKKVKARLFVGRVWAAVTKLFGNESTFEVETQNAVAGVRGTKFEAARDESGTTTVKVYNGKVLVSNKPIYAIEGHSKGKRVQVLGPQEISKKQWDELVAGAMQMVQIAAAGEMSPVQSFAMTDAATDDWEKWNSERDKLAGVGE